MVTRVCSVPSPSLRPRLVRTAALAIAIACAWGLPLSAQQGTPLRKIGELELAIRGLTATVEPRLTVPKNIASGVRIDVRAGTATATAADAVRLLGGEFRLKGELSGPGLAQTLPLPEGAPDVDPFLLRLPGLTRPGHYTLANLRLVRGEGADERTILDVVPNAVDIEVIDEVLLTSVTTRPLTLDEIKQKGIVLDADDYLGFEFTLAMKLESTPVNVSFPVVFDRQGVAKPEYLRPPDVSRSGVVLPTIVPVLLEATTPGRYAWIEHPADARRRPGGPDPERHRDPGQRRLPEAVLLGTALRRQRRAGRCPPHRPQHPGHHQLPCRPGHGPRDHRRSPGAGGDRGWPGCEDPAGARPRPRRSAEHRRRPRRAGPG